MSTVTTYVKGGTLIACDTSLQPRPRPLAAWPLPTVDTTANSYLVLSNYADTVGNQGVQITGTQALAGPGWTLYYLTYTGSMSTNPAWVNRPLNTINNTTLVSLVISPIAGNATFLAYLTQTVGTQVVTYAQASLITASNITQSTANSALSSGGNLIPNGDASLGPLPGPAGNLVYDTTQGGTLPASGYLGARYVRSTLQGRQGSTAITGMIPVNAGDNFSLIGWVKAVSNNYVTGGILITGYNADGITPSNFTTGTASATSYTPVNGLTYWSPGQWYYFGPSPISGNPWWLGNGGCFTVPVAGQNGTTGQVAFLQLSLTDQYNTNDFWFANLELIKLPASATTGTAGLVKAGSGLAVAQDGTLSVIDGATDKYFAYSQGTASTTWTICHGLNKYPSVSVATSAGIWVYGVDVDYVDANNVVLSYASAFAGTAYFN